MQPGMQPAATTPAAAPAAAATAEPTEPPAPREFMPGTALRETLMHIAIMQSY
jgi:hypothetical protein